MKKITILAICLLFTIPTWASHLNGGELRYEFNGVNYTIEATYYQECNSLIYEDSLNLNMQSSCETRSKYLHLSSVDTLYEMYCPSYRPDCSTTTTWMAVHYTDTVSLDSCSDWYFSVHSSSYDVSIRNMNVSGDMYLDAFLDNSSGVNSNPVTKNFRPFYISGSLATFPLQTADPDGDSVVMKMITPTTTGGSSLYYNPGYSASSPLGSGGYIDLVSGDHIVMKGSMAGKYLLGMRTYEYRGGTLVGYTSRQWVSTDFSTTIPQNPMISASDALEYTTHPGETDTITVHFSDSTSTDSVFVDFQPANYFTYTTSSSPDAGSATGTISWTTPSFIDPATTPNFYIYVRAHSNACPLAGDTWYTLLVHVAHIDDSVWAGDANGDHTVNIYDPLTIGVAYGKTGPSRPGASTTWMAQYCPPWSYTFASGINMNNADCDGNGTVNLSDLGAVISNYGDTHPKGGISSTERITGLPDLQFDMSGVALVPGSTVNIPVTMGSSSLPISKLYGIAGSITISGITPTTNPSITIPSTTWLGTSSATLNLIKAENTNKIDFAYVKTDHTNSNGEGTLGTLSFTVPAGASIGQQVVLSFNGIKAIDKDGKEVTATFNVVNDTSAVSTSVASVTAYVQNVAVIPNPATGYANLKLSLQHSDDLNITITDLAGKTIWQKKGNYDMGDHTISLPAGQIVAGMYFVHVSGNNWQYPVLKWVKE